MSQKKTSVTVTSETEEAVIEKAWRNYRIRSWQGAVDLALQQFVESPAARTGSNVLELPEGLTDADVTLLRNAALDLVEANAKAAIEKLEAIEKMKADADKAREKKKGVFR